MPVVKLSDGGTHKSSPVVTMAGYVAHQHNWEKFERSSKRLFKKYDISLFHAKQFFHRKGEFRGWQVARQLRFATELFEVAEPLMLRGVGISIEKASFNKARQDHNMLQSVGPFVYCISPILRKLCGDGEVWEAIEREGFSVTLEDGNKNNTAVQIEFRKIAHRHQLEEYLRSIEVEPKGSSRALQLADYLAYFSRQEAERATLGTLNDRTHSEFLDIATTHVATNHGLAEDFKPNPEFERKFGRDKSRRTA